MYLNIYLHRYVFFCWRLLGLVPGGAPFSHLSSGVKDAMVVSTKLVKCHFVTKTCKKADWNNTKRWNKKPSTECTRTAKEGSGDVAKTTPVPEGMQKHRKKMALVKPSGSTYARASVQVTRKWRIWRRRFSLLAFNWVFRVKYCFVRSQVRGKPSSNGFS